MQSEAYYQLALMFSQTERFNQAERNYIKALELNPENQDFVKSYGNFLISQDRQSEVESLYANNMKQDSLLPQSYYNMAKLNSSKKEYDSSLTNYKKAIQLADGFYPEAYLNMGLVYKKKNNFDAAIESYKIALKQNEYYHEANYNLALLFLKKGDTLK